VQLFEQLRKGFWDKVWGEKKKKRKRKGGGLPGGGRKKQDTVAVSNAKGARSVKGGKGGSQVLRGEKKEFKKGSHQ